MKVFVGDILENKLLIPLLATHFGSSKKNNSLFQNINPVDFADIFSVVGRVEEADYIIFPHNYFPFKFEKSFIERYEGLAEKSGKKIIVIASGDSDEEVKINHSIILRTSQYASKIRENEILMPVYIEDISKIYPFYARQKSDLPVVGFCGWGTVKGFLPSLKFYIKNYLMNFGVKKQGIYFRKKAIAVLRSSGLVKSNFIIRNSFSGHKKTIEILPEKAREEYINNILESDFVLAPRGDGNYSLRFYEILALGRIPVLIDTDIPLPLEKKLDYSKFILRISYKDADKLPKIISEFYKNISEDEFLNMQKLAREVFQKYLRQDMFFRFVFNGNLESF